MSAEGDELLRAGEPRDHVAVQVTEPIDTSATSGSPSPDGIAIASGFVPVGTGARRWAPAAAAARSPSEGDVPGDGDRRTQYPSAPVGKQPLATTRRAPPTPSAITSSQIAESVRYPRAPPPSQRWVPPAQGDPGRHAVHVYGLVSSQGIREKP